jgi:hypothetical protein
MAMPKWLGWMGFLLALLIPAASLAAPGRERAIEQIPELMGRILESQEEIRERESEMTPVIEGYNAQLGTAKQRIEGAASEQQAAEALVDYVEAYAARLEQLGTAKQRIEGAASEQQAAEALVDYVEAYAARLEAQEEGLHSIEGAVVRMRADARDLIRAAELARRRPGETREERDAFFTDQFQGVASATGQLAERLDREGEAATAGAVLHASWASHGALELPLQELGPDGAIGFARKVEGLYARFQARSNQLAAERRSVRRLLDMLIERQLAQRLDALFAGGEGLGLGALLSGEGKSEDWQDLGAVVSRTLGLPVDAPGLDGERHTASLERLDYFARGGHRR